MAESIAESQSRASQRDSIQGSVHYDLMGASVDLLKEQSSQSRQHGRNMNIGVMNRTQHDNTVISNEKNSALG